MAADSQDGLCVGHVSFYDRYGFAVYNPGSELAEEDCNNHVPRAFQNANEPPF